MIKRCLILFVFAVLIVNFLCASSRKQVQDLLAQAKENLTGSMDLAVKQASEALIYAQELKLPREAAQAELYLAKGYHQAGVYDQALNRCQQALKGFEQLHDNPGMADAWEQLGYIYWRLQRGAEVQESFNKSLALRRKLSDQAALADALNNIGIFTLHYLHQADKAYAYYTEALQKSRLAGHKLGIAHSLNNLGNYWLMQGDVANALAYNEQSLELYQVLGDRNRVAINTLIIGYLHQLQGDNATAERMYLESVKLAQKNKAAATVRDAYLNLSALYEMQGRELQHLKYYKDYAELADSIMSAETNRNITNLQIQHAVEKRELENKILRLNIQKQRYMLGFFVLFSLGILCAVMLINRERKRSEKLLLNILPRKVATELKLTGHSEPQVFQGVSVLFSDFVDFTSTTATMAPADVIGTLSELFTAFDALCAEHGCERIKTIGDAYLAVCGLPQACPDHEQRMLELARGMLEVVNSYNLSHPVAWHIRIGLHCGEVVGGIVGKTKYIYDVFGDTINTASRMESNSLPMRINVSEEFYRGCASHDDFEAREALEVKGKGQLKMYFVKTQLN